MAPTKRMLYSEEAMEAAVKAVTERKKGMREAARHYGVPDSTLRDRIKGRKSMRKIQRTALTSANESRLVSWLEESARRGFGRTKDQVLNSVQEVIRDNNVPTPFKEGQPGDKWFQGFLKRHSKSLSIRTPQALGSQRAAVTGGKIRGWFRTAHAEITKENPDVLNHPERIFNCDESRFQLAGGLVKVLAPKGDKRVSSDARHA
ncbi:tigger transposable element-derived protein 6-like protein [Elysia marginata]|uniref:Tigger transposable element-derived protein 6-like protein n=1 Tax=Elysia marginata TaxID=1093978 RepID=A0AAV4GBW1_9GAST|nr:tigger transposable element-derived protein 6-like protein [Elysia marginata]